MEIFTSYHFFFNGFFLVFALLIFSSYVSIGVLSTIELKFYRRRNRHFRYNDIKSFKILPTVSIVAPAFNEERSIIENIRSLLSLEYPKAEVIIVNDGSNDNTLSLIIEHYKMVKVDLAYSEKIPTSPIRGIYRSREEAYNKLTVVDKVNGGKGDALNAGLNICRNDLFLAIDVDCIIESDALLKMVKPFLEEEGEKRVIASGGVIRVANSCEITDGRITKVRYPKNLLAKFQVLEYFRAFTLGRMAWSKVNGLLIISGAFGLFDRRVALNAGGYDPNTVGEDLELVVRMRKYMHLVKEQKYRVAFIPDPLCWTEVPSKFKTLSRQRNRWTRGAIDTIFKHKDMFFNSRYGKIGMISFPYWVFFEWLAPIVEMIGITYFIFMLAFNMVNFKIFIILLVFVFAFSVIFSSFAVFYETYAFNKYKGVNFLSQVILIAISEVFLFHPLNLFFSLSGNFDYLFGSNRQQWGEMTRTGFNHYQTKEK